MCKAFHGYKSLYGIPNDERPSDRRAGTIKLGDVFSLDYECSTEGKELDWMDVRKGINRSHFDGSDVYALLDLVLAEVGSSMSEFFSNVRRENTEKEI